MGLTYREIVYFVLDSIKSLNGDSTITEEHVIYLANHYRLFLLEQKKLKQGISSLSSSNEQTICVDLERTNAIQGLDYCNDVYLRSSVKVPNVLDELSIKVGLSGLFTIRTAFVSSERFKFVGNNKYLSNILYCTLGPDNYIYFTSANPQFKYIKKATITGIFEDAEEASKLSCNSNNSSQDTGCKEFLDSEFPLEADLVPQLLELIIRQLLGVNYKPKDDKNNSNDDLADIAAFIRRNLKTPLAKQLTE